MKLRTKIAATLAVAGIILGAQTIAPADTAEAYTLQCGPVPIRKKTTLTTITGQSGQLTQTWCSISGISWFEYYVLGVRPGWQWVNGYH